MKTSELQGRPVISMLDTRKLGFVDGILLDATGQHVVGLRVKTPQSTEYEAILLRDVTWFGDDRVELDDPRKLNHESRFPELRDTVDLDVLAKYRVTSRQGEALGTVSDLEVDTETGAVTSFHVCRGLIDRVKRQAQPVPAVAVQVADKGRIVMAEECFAV